MGSCMVAQCSEPCCRRYARQSTGTGMCPGKTLCRVRTASSSFIGWAYVGTKMCVGVMR